MIGTVLPNRSLQLKPLDLDAAAMESEYLSGNSRQKAVSGPDAAEMVGTLSDQLFGRYGTWSISHAILAYWDETCPALTGWAGVDVTGFGLPGQLLRICQLTTPDVPHWATRWIRPPACVVVVRDDGIVTPAMTDWLAERRGWPISARIGGGHGNSLGLGRCSGEATAAP